MKPEVEILKRFFKEEAAKEFLAAGWLELWKLEEDNTKRWLLQQLEENKKMKSSVERIITKALTRWQKAMEAYYN